MKNDDDTVRDAKRKLEQLAAEGGLSAVPVMKSASHSLRDHFGAKDVDKTDAVELWGTRIARGLAVIGFVLLAYWVYRQMSQ